jgi:hypothetical protein
MSRRRDKHKRAASRDDDADIGRVRTLLERLHALLTRIGNARAASIDALSARFAADPAGAWREIDGNGWWAGAGSIAADSMADNPGIADSQWQAEICEFRELLIEIGEILRARGDTNPGLSSWLLAFRNWLDSGV